jgi:hypothetical protein
MEKLVQLIRAVLIVVVLVPFGIAVDVIDSFVTFISCLLMLSLVLFITPIVIGLNLVMPYHPATQTVEDFYMDTLNVLINSHKVFFPNDVV